MKKPVPFSLAPTGIREACAVLLAATLASGAFAAPAPATSDPAVKKAAPGESPRLTIAHDPLKCLSTEARPLIDAKVLPTKELDQGFVYFRAAGTEDYYYVLMKPRADERSLIEAALDRAVDHWQLIERGEYPAAMQKLNTTTNP